MIAPIAAKRVGRTLKRVPAYFRFHLTKQWKRENDILNFERKKSPLASRRAGRPKEQTTQVHGSEN
ncbi:hypothetical protein TTRE_0000024001 [Trichuris trichiura]|uniref:Uncharacterized protein n=1 Tax=Trichuris trichiura TaxID=36087 RepID=A0A077YW05_TRITR|nr:hypothetical protein TTRE_0000024001 [Trichuris trichiura]